MIVFLFNIEMGVKYMYLKLIKKKKIFDKTNILCILVIFAIDFLAERLLPKKKNERKL